MTFRGCMRLLRNDSAKKLGLKLCSRAYFFIISRRARLMRGLSFSARDTVATETPSSRAISFIVMDVDSFMLRLLVKWALR